MWWEFLILYYTGKNGNKNNNNNNNKNKNKNNNNDHDHDHDHDHDNDHDHDHDHDHDNDNHNHNHNNNNNNNNSNSNSNNNNNNDKNYLVAYGGLVYLWRWCYSHSPRFHLNYPKLNLLGTELETFHLSAKGGSNLWLSRQLTTIQPSNPSSQPRPTPCRPNVQGFWDCS